jgi:outer membrane biosynthesis protein TonB
MRMMILAALLLSMHSAVGVATSASPMPPPAAEVARPPQPHGTAASLFSVDDYPAAARGTGAHGKVVARLTIDTTGRVVGCDVVHSSGFRVLDGRRATSCGGGRAMDRGSTRAASRW